MTRCLTECFQNDDLDLQVIDLEIIRRFGLPVNRHHLTTLWEHLQDGGPDEYGAGGDRIFFSAGTLAAEWVLLQ